MKQRVLMSLVCPGFIRSVQVSVSGVPLCRTGSKEFLATELQLSSSATFEGA